MEQEQPFHDPYNQIDAFNRAEEQRWQESRFPDANEEKKEDEEKEERAPLHESNGPSHRKESEDTMEGNMRDAGIRQDNSEDTAKIAENLNRLRMRQQRLRDLEKEMSLSTTVPLVGSTPSYSAYDLSDVNEEEAGNSLFVIVTVVFVVCCITALFFYKRAFRSYCHTGQKRYSRFKA